MNVRINGIIDMIDQDHDNNTSTMWIILDGSDTDHPEYVKIPHIDYYVGISDYQSEEKTKFIEQLKRKAIYLN